MNFEHEQDVLQWYESHERILNKAFLDSIPWSDVADYNLQPQFIPVLIYMRDVEKFTDIYYNELLHTPTGKDPIIRRFMDRWAEEETLHADLLNRFLNEAGYPTSDRWYDEARTRIPMLYPFTSRLTTLITNSVGKHFSAVHMTWGAINEYSTLTGYQRLWELAKHPVLEYILRGIAREEAQHSFFYWNIARINLSQSHFRQQLARFIVDHFWAPVGSGLKNEPEANMVIRTLFRGIEGIEHINERVNARIAQLPGFNGDTVITDRIRQAAASN